MTDFSLNTSFDYVNKTITASLVTPGVHTGFLSNPEYRLVDNNGVLINRSLLEKASGSNAFTSYISTFNMDMDLSIYNGGYDTSIYRTDLSGVYVSIPQTMWEMQAEVGVLQSFVRALELAYVSTTDNILDTRNDVYNDTPLVIDRGDSVLQGAIATVTDKNKITITVDRSLAAYSGYNLKNSFMEVISGSASGQIYTVVGQNLNTLIVDKDCYGLSGQTVKFKPYRIVTSYSGLSYNGTGSNLGENGLKARFGVNDTIPGKIGSLYYTSGYYSGTAMVDYPNDVFIGQGLSLYSASTVALKNDTYLRDVQQGDLIFYNPASSPSSINTGVILYVGPHANAAQGDYYVQYWPATAAYTGSTYTIYRSNISTLQSYPKFDSTYVAMATYTLTTGNWMSSVTTPKINSVDFTANEQESTYNFITETSHFFVGPVQISNGQSLVYTTGNPSILVSGFLYQGDPANLVTALATGIYCSQNPDIGDKFKGQYFDGGVATFTCSSAFTTAQTVTFESEIRFGPNKIVSINTIPVQPAV